MLSAFWPLIYLAIGFGVFVVLVMKHAVDESFHWFIDYSPAVVILWPIALLIELFGGFNSDC